MKRLEILYFKYIQDLIAKQTPTTKMTNKHWRKGVDIDAEYALSTAAERESILKSWEIKMKEFKEQGYKVDKYILN